MKVKDAKALLDTFDDEAELVLLGEDSTTYDIKNCDTAKDSKLVWFEIKETGMCDGC